MQHDIAILLLTTNTTYHIVHTVHIRPLILPARGEEEEEVGDEVLEDHLAQHMRTTPAAGGLALAPSCGRLRVIWFGVDVVRGVLWILIEMQEN